MEVKKFWNRLFNGCDSDTFVKAKKSISHIREKLNEIIVVFPDVTIGEMVFLKNQWLSLPSKLGQGVAILGVDIKDDYKLLVTKFSSNGYLLPHEHSKNYELNKVISGEIYDSINNLTYKTGEVFMMDKNHSHALSSKGETYLLTLFTTNKSKLRLPENFDMNLLSI